MGQLGLRRAALYLLSSRIVDPWHGPGFRAALENSAGRIYLADAAARGVFDVAVCTRMASASRGRSSRGSLRRKSISSSPDLLPARLRGTACERAVSAGGVGRAARAS